MADDVLGRRWMRGQERLERLLHLQCCDVCVSGGGSGYCCTVRGGEGAGEAERDDTMHLERI